jgi:hypothetical protein
LEAASVLATNSAEGKMMKKIALFLALAVLSVSCVVRDDSGNYAGSYTRDEAWYLTLRYASTPVFLLDILLECSDFINASEEERQEDRFAACREDLMFSYTGKYKIENKDIVFSAGTLPLGVKGGRYEVNCAVMGYYGEKVSFVLECIEDGLKWDMTEGGGTVTHCELAGESTYKVSVSGTRKSGDGYDLAFSMYDGFSVSLDADRYPHPGGVMRHTVSDGAELLMTCLTTWKDGQPVSVISNNK